jgi:hypothetical protein
VTNVDLLAEKLLGPGINDFRWFFRGNFYFLFMFQLLDIYKVVFFVCPVYLIA